MTDPIEVHAQKLYQEAIVIDGTMVIFRDFVNYLRKIRDAGVTAVVLTLVGNESFTTTVRSICDWYRRLGKASDFAFLLEKVSDIEKAKKEGRVAVVFACQSGSPIENEIGFLNILRKLGLRVMTLAYNQRNLIGDGSTERTDCGLSAYGVEVVQEMNRLGMVIDLSHCGDQTTLDAIEISTQPVIASHSNARGLCNHPRNVTDQIIRNLAKKGGILGINAYPAFLKIGKTATFEDFLDHIDYVYRLVGADHIGLGLDIAETRMREDYLTRDGELGFGSTKYDPKLFLPWPWFIPEEINSVSKVSNITEALLKRGYSDEDVRKIMGENYLRVFKTVIG